MFNCIVHILHLLTTVTWHEDDYVASFHICTMICRWLLQRKGGLSCTPEGERWLRYTQIHQPNPQQHCALSTRHADTLQVECMHSVHRWVHESRARALFCSTQACLGQVCMYTYTGMPHHTTQQSVSNNTFQKFIYIQLYTITVCVCVCVDTPSPSRWDANRSTVHTPKDPEKWGTIYTPMCHTCIYIHTACMQCARIHMYH